MRLIAERLVPNSSGPSYIAWISLIQQCEACPAGSWCSGGLPGAQPRACSRGMYANETGSEGCSSCSAGTYVRSLARDLGDQLGCGGALAQLRRTAALGFTLEASLPLEALGLVLGGQVLPEETMIYELELPPSSEEEPVVSTPRVGARDGLQAPGVRATCSCLCAAAHVSCGRVSLPCLVSARTPTPQASACSTKAAPSRARPASAMARAPASLVFSQWSQRSAL